MVASHAKVCFKILNAALLDLRDLVKAEYEQLLLSFCFIITMIFHILRLCWVLNTKAKSKKRHT